MKFIPPAIAALALAMALAGSAAAAQGEVSFDVFLPLRDPAGLERLIEQQQDERSPLYRRWLTPQDFKTRFGADPDAMARIAKVLREAGFAVAEHAASLRATGSVAATERLFATRLARVARPHGKTGLAAADPLVLPRELTEAGAQILAFAARQPMWRVHVALSSLPANRSSPVGPYWYDDLKQAYDYPSYTAKAGGRTLTGQGVNIGILTASDVLDSDIQAYFDHENFAATAGTPDPAVFMRVPVLGGAPFDAGSDNSFEATLDVEQALGGAPGAALYLYVMPDLGDDSISAGMVDIDEDDTVDVLSISFGACEKLYTEKYNFGQSYVGIIYSLHDLFLQGNAEGITFIASAGDSGGLGCPNLNYITDGLGVTDTGGPYNFVAGVETPASDPAVTAVGGTNLVTRMSQTSLTSAYVGENAEGDPEIPYDPYGLGINVSGGYWGAGGGVSAIFARPAYQANLPIQSTMRLVPDIGMQVGGCPYLMTLRACPPSGPHSARSAVEEYFAGSLVQVIGTSVAAPEFAGAVALWLQKRGYRLGNINPLLYAKATEQEYGGFTVFHHDIPGYDGHFLAQPGAVYNFMTGIGTPRVRTLIDLQDAKPAGDPQTQGNP